MKLFRAQQHRFTAGFTLVETLVAVLLLTIVIVGPITIAQRGVQNADYANEEVVAVFLAEEAIEAVRTLRDNAALESYDVVGFGANTTSWYASLDADCINGTGCGYDPVLHMFDTCSVLNGDCTLLRDAGTGYLSYAFGGSDSGFSRRVHIGSFVNGGVSVRVEVVWSPRTFGGATRTVTLQTWIYDHYRRYDND